MAWTSHRPATSQQPPTFQQQITDYVATGHSTRAAAAWLVTPEGTKAAFAGHTGNDQQPVPTATTLFEIGSITKVFTGILLADMVEQGQVNLNTPLGILLPDDNGPTPVDTMTLQQLATHTAGLPRLPLGLVGRALLHRANPYQGTQKADIYRAIARITPKQAGDFRYSNLGFALLGHLLADAAGVRYETLLQEQVLQPLGLEHTVFEVSPESAQNLAQGHQANLLPTANWQLDAYRSAGGLKSTLADMGTFLAAAMAADWSPMARSLQSYEPRGDRGAMGLGWIIDSLEGQQLIMHNGQTGGYYAFVGWLPEAGRGLVLLTNSSSAESTGVARALLAQQPLPSPTPPWGLLSISLWFALVLGYQGWILWQVPQPAERKSTARIQGIAEVSATAFLLVLTLQLGPWNWLPISIWWVVLASLAGLASRSFWLLRQQPWCLPHQPWHTGMKVAQAIAFFTLSLWVGLGFR